MSKSSESRIHFRCACGQKIAVPSEWAGKRAACPKCRKPQMVPPPEARISGAAAVSEPDTEADDFFPSLSEGEPLRVAAPITQASPEDGKTCPGCGQVWAKTAKICVNCGVDLKSGRAVAIRDEEHLDQSYVVAESVAWWLSWPDPIGLYPFASDAFGSRKPWVTRAVFGLTVIVSVWFYFVALDKQPPDEDLQLLMQWSGSAPARTAFFEEKRVELRNLGVEEELLDEFIPTPESDRPGEYRWYQPITCALLHDGIFHLAGNMLFLYVFGSRVNMLIGNVLTLAAYPLLCFAAGLTHHYATASEPLIPLIGASGAVMGLAGMYLVLFPATRVHVVFWIRPWFLFFIIFYFALRLYLWSFSVRGFWVVLFYIAFDFVYVYLRAEDGVAHWAHIGGFLGGVALGTLLLLTRLIDARGGDLISLALGQRAWTLLGRPTAKRLSLP